MFSPMCIYVCPLSLSLVIISTRTNMVISGVTGGGRGQSAPKTSEVLTGKYFCWPSGKKEARGKGWKLRRKEGIQNCKREGVKLEMEGGKVTKWGGPFFFFFFFFLSLSLFKTTNLFWVYQNGNFLPGKSILRRGKNQEKWLLPPQSPFVNWTLKAKRITLFYHV